MIFGRAWYPPWHSSGPPGLFPGPTYVLDTPCICLGPIIGPISFSSKMSKKISNSIGPYLIFLLNQRRYLIMGVGAMNQDTGPQGALSSTTWLEVWNSRPSISNNWLQRNGASSVHGMLTWYWTNAFFSCYQLGLLNQFEYCSFITAHVNSIGLVWTTLR